MTLLDSYYWQQFGIIRYNCNDIKHAFNPFFITNMDNELKNVNNNKVSFN